MKTNLRNPEYQTVLQKQLMSKSKKKLLSNLKLNTDMIVPIKEEKHSESISDLKSDEEKSVSSPDFKEASKSFGSSSFSSSEFTSSILESSNETSVSKDSND